MDPNLIYDVGMHKGEDTHFYLSKGFKVIAFEANPELVGYCQEKFSKEIAANQLVIVEGAIVKEDFAENFVTFYRNDRNSVWGTTKQEWEVRNELLGAKSTVIEVRPINFKSALQHYGIPYYCKIDVEGVDMLCLRTLGKYNDRPEFVSIESEYKSIQAIREELKLFKDLGYNKLSIVQQATLHKRGRVLLDQEGQSIEYQFEIGSSGAFGDDLDSEWISINRAIFQYLKIYALDRLLAERNDASRSQKIRRIRKWYENNIQPMGWYDVHAKRL
jgi:FkbM family methyltransferase